MRINMKGKKRIISLKKIKKFFVKISFPTSTFLVNETIVNSRYTMKMITLHLFFLKKLFIFT